jgi:hypothetical protein
MNFHASFCDPFSPDIIDLGRIEKENILTTFSEIPWTNYLQDMQGRPDDDIHYSPSLEIENRDNQQSLSISAVGEPSGFEFYIFYKRPKIVKTFLGLFERVADDYLTDITGQTEQDVLACLHALINHDFDYLEKKIP